MQKKATLGFSSVALIVYEVLFCFESVTSVLAYRADEIVADFALVEVAAYCAAVSLFVFCFYRSRFCYLLIEVIGD